MWGKVILPVLYLSSFISLAAFLIRPASSDQNVFDKPGGHKHSKHFGEEENKNIVFQMPSLIYKAGKWEPVPDEDVQSFNSNENNENNEKNHKEAKSSSGSIFDDQGSDGNDNDNGNDYSEESADNHSENPNDNLREFIMNGSSPFNYVRRLLRTQNVTIGEPLTWTFSKKRPRRDAKEATTARSTGSHKDPHEVHFIYGSGSRHEKEGRSNPKGIDDAPNMNSNKTRNAADENHRRTQDAANNS